MSSVSVVNTTVSTTSGNVLSLRNFTLAEMVPDVSAGRTIMLHGVVATFTGASAPFAAPGGMAQVVLYGSPWVNAGSASAVYASQNWKALNASTRTALRVSVNQSGQRVPVELDRTGPAVQLRAQSLLAGSWQVELQTRYSLLVDTVTTYYP